MPIVTAIPGKLRDRYLIAFGQSIVMPGEKLPEVIKLGRGIHSKLKLGPRHGEMMTAVSDHAWNSREHLKASLGQTSKFKGSRSKDAGEHKKERGNEAEEARWSMFEAITRTLKANPKFEEIIGDNDIASFIEVGMAKYLNTDDVKPAITTPKVAHKVFEEIMKDLWAKGELKKKRR